MLANVIIGTVLLVDPWVATGLAIAPITAEH
jgi:hypothetical protein